MVCLVILPSKPFTPFADRGFSPCVLRGQAGAGFEIFYGPSNAVAEEDKEDFWEIIGTKQFCQTAYQDRREKRL
ncbi:hypothetical protein AADEFJLK_03803 [Methylovulum psychrotolerans]|uniref:Uncharacterized protein n=1 Tax=Methylovulum psychrotolerans TaxID=1704499 RepID=A0A2S5CHU5_9GAMM|nr:hypothetical protein AADEFJLK_03803 [Methylovulum psychrotolerans]